MALDNLVAVEIPPKTLDELQNKIKEISNMLAPFLIALTPQERKRRPKMGEGTVTFVKKTLAYAQANPELVPSFVDVANVEQDVNAVRDLNSLFRPLHQLTTGLDDTMLLSGSEAYVAALSIYNSIKQGARANVPGARGIYEDLSTRFDGQRRKRKPATPKKDDA